MGILLFTQNGRLDKNVPQIGERVGGSPRRFEEKCNVTLHSKVMF